MNIPEEMLPKITMLGNSPKLPPENNRWIRDASPANKAEKYFDEALRKLALAKFWAEQDELQ